ncbi:heme oxygenase [Bradyrhizobium sp. LA6.1]|jgi:heme oxygenase
MPRWKGEWTEQEVEKLRLLAATMPLTLIAKELNRTVGTMLAKATYEKIKIIVHTRSGRA